MAESSSNNKKKKKVGAGAGAGSTAAAGLSMLDLPCDVLEHMLSLLPSRDAVRTCVLSKDYHHKWKSVPALRIDDTVDNCRKFMDNFLRSRNGHSPIDVCRIQFNICRDSGDGHVRTCGFNTWVTYVLEKCRVRDLGVMGNLEGGYLILHNRALISRHLRRLELGKVELRDLNVDLSGCPVLEDVEFILCSIAAKKIVSKSVKRLTMESCEFSSVNGRTRICVPNLVSLKLVYVWDTTPVLESMPLLQDACVKFSDACCDFCQFSDYWGCGNEQCNICTCIDDGKESVLLQGLSDATHLELINEPHVFIFERDLRLCPIFTNLRTLVLNGFFVVADLRGFVRIIRNSPILEELNLLLFEESTRILEIVAGHNLTGQVHRLSSVKNLNQVKVRCEKQYFWVKIIIQTLMIMGIDHRKIIIEAAVEEDSSSSQDQLTVGFPHWGYF